MGSRVDERDELTVLVTGFGPFRAQYPVNPSWEIVKDLPTYLPPLRTKDPVARSLGSAMDLPPVRIRVHPEPIRVNYEVVRALVPNLWEPEAAHEAGEVEPDIVLHVGMAGPRPVYQIERRGHRTGYKAPDVDGQFLVDEGEGGHGADWIWADCPDEIETDVDLDDVLTRWRRHAHRAPVSHDSGKEKGEIEKAAGGPDLIISEDAGRYLCDFIYYSSLAYRWRCGRRRQVTFLHVPADASSVTVEKGRELAIALIRGLVESEVARKRGWGKEETSTETAE